MVVFLLLFFFLLSNVVVAAVVLVVLLVVLMACCVNSEFILLLLLSFNAFVKPTRQQTGHVLEGPLVDQTWSHGDQMSIKKPCKYFSA